MVSDVRFNSVSGIWPFCACALHPAIIIGTVRSLLTWLWGKYHIPQNIFSVFKILLKSIFILYFPDTLKKYLAHRCVCACSFQNIPYNHSAYPRWRTSRFGSRGSLLSELPMITGKLADDDDLPRTWVCWGFALGRMLSTWLWFKHNTWITLHCQLKNGRSDQTGRRLTMSLSKNKPTCLLEIWCEMFINICTKNCHKVGTIILTDSH